MSTTAADLARSRCKPCEGGVSPLQPAEVQSLLQHLDGWALAGSVIEKTYRFKNYYQALAFVNATAWISHREDHHPDITLGFNECRVAYTTHAINGLSQNDFICAAKLDALFDL
jgi:4a-hydroxytetrahydrobiopterin dehydratase